MLEINNREILEQYGVDCLLVNSTNEFLVEYNLLEDNSRYKITNFSGSTGDALVTPETIFLFVDGRYHIQADLEVDHSRVEVVKLLQGQKFVERLALIVGKNKTIGVFAKKNSQAQVELFKKYFNVKLLNEDIFTPEGFAKKLEIESVPGISPEEKVQGIQSVMSEDEAILITNAEEVSYIFNKRSYSSPYSSKIYGKAIIYPTSVELFMPEAFGDFYDEIKNFQGKIFVDKATINAFDYNLIKDKAVEMKANPIRLMKCVKAEEEIDHLKSAFERTDNALLALRNFIETNENLSEFDIAQRLEEEFYKQGAKGLSFKSIVAKDKNSALAHYSKSSKDEIVQDGSLVLVDCGAYFEEGLATDITRVFVKGTPTELQKQVYTTVLRTFLNCYNCQNFETGYDIDATARFFIQSNLIEGFVFNHGLGHGIGINVHENPPSLSPSELGKSKIKNNMCFTIEPGLYNEKHFGVRLENSCYLDNGKIQSFSSMPFESKLINFDLLSEQEKEWLEEFEVI